MNLLTCEIYILQHLGDDKYLFQIAEPLSGYGRYPGNEIHRGLGQEARGGWRLLPGLPQHSLCIYSLWSEGVEDKY